MKKVIGILLVLLVIKFWVGNNYKLNGVPHKFHTQQELKMFKKIAGGKLPKGKNEFFIGSGSCIKCHGKDSAGRAMVDKNGNDVSPVTDWRATMMANSAKDPLWRAKVSHEILVNPKHKIALESKCTSCHAPQGNYAKRHIGKHDYLIEDMLKDSVAMDGVGCVTCHTISADSMGFGHSGNIKFDTTKLIYGPYDVFWASNMYLETGYSPAKSEHLNDPNLCRACHTLLTDAVDLDGNPTGKQFVEQATYQEWQNSNYSSEEVSCQSCHIPRITDSVIISNQPSSMGPHTPFGKHFLVGGNSFMLEILKNNIDELDIAASEENFDSVISRTVSLLQKNSVRLKVNDIYNTADSLLVDVSLENLAGHKFPSGYPSRRAFVEFKVSDKDGEVLFHSGKMNDEYMLSVDDAKEFETHHNIISKEDRVQIYEMVMGDVNDDVTTVLERAYTTLKDNRLTPRGFSTKHFSYDTTKIEGKAKDDLDFNLFEDGKEGTGIDIIHYYLPLSIKEHEKLHIEINLHYQSVPLRWLKEMFDFKSEEIDKFKEMYEKANKAPVLIADTLFTYTPKGIEELKLKKLKFYPNPTADIVYFEGVDFNKIKNVNLYDNNGKLIFSKRRNQLQGKFLELPDFKGNYFIEILTKDNHRFSGNVQKIK